MAAKNKFMNAMKMPAIADMFSSEADRQRESGDLVTEVPLSELHPFVNHPFEVRDDEDMPVMRYPPDIQKRSRCPAAQTGFKVGIKTAKMLTEMWNGHRFCIAWTGKNCMGLWTA